MRRLPRWLGVAGLIPQILLVAIEMGERPIFGPAARGLALAYAALILSFIGGTWWGFASQAGERAPPWLWFAAVLPSLIAFAALAACAVAWSPAPSLLVTGAALIAALRIDFKLAKEGLCPPGWLSLRMPLSLGLGGLCIFIAVTIP